MKSSPKVFLKIKFELAMNNQDNIFASSKTNYKVNRDKDVVKMLDYFRDKNKSPQSMLEYFSANYKSLDNNFNLVKEDGTKLSKKELNKRCKEISNYIENSNLWKGFFSFKTEYLINNISLEKLEKKIALEVFPNFFKKCGFVDVSKMNYQFSIHVDKAHHYHIHFSFCEKRPNTKNRDNKLSYRRKGMINQELQDFLKREIVLSIERENKFSPLLIELNKDIDEFKKYFSVDSKDFILKDINNIDLEFKLLKLGKLLQEYKPNSDKIKYGSIKNNDLGKEIKNLTNEIKREVFKNAKKDFNLSKEKIENDFTKLNDFYTKLNKDNNIERKIKNNDLLLTKKKYINSYVMNAIINFALKNSKGKITIDDYIKNVATKNIINKSDKELKKIALRNYFTGKNYKEKYKLNYEIVSAIKKLNNEMEECAEKFHELFEEDNNYER